MKRSNGPGADGKKAEVQEAKAAVRQSIGKLIGDDAEVREGLAEQERVRKSHTPHEQDEQE